MKYNIVFKFLAIVLCAAMLLSAAAGVLGIFAMNEAGLYQRTVEEAYDQYLRNQLESYGAYLAQRTAAMEKGGLTDAAAESYYSQYHYHGNSFRFGRLGYTVRDENGNTLAKEELHQEYPMVHRVSIPVTGQEYISMVSLKPREQMEETTEPLLAYGESMVYDAVPLEGARVYGMTVGYPDSSEGVSSEEDIGMLYHDSEGHVVFNANQEGLVDPSNRSQLIHIWFEDADQNILFEASDPEGVGLLYSDTSGFVKFQSNAVNPAFAPAATEPETLAPTEEAPLSGEVIYNGFSSGANIYALPSRDSDVLATVPVEMDISISGEYDVNGALWYLTEQGWIPAEPVGEAGEAQPDNGPAAVSGAGADIFSTPNSGSAPLGKLDPGETYEIIRSVSVMDKEWLLLKEGWVSVESLEPSQLTGDYRRAAEPTVVIPQAAEETVPQETAAQTLPEESAAQETKAVMETVVPTEVTETVEVTEAMEAEAAPYRQETAAEAVPAEAAYPNDLRTFEYYDPEYDQVMVLEYTYQELPEYTVVFNLAENALRYEYEWVLLRAVYSLREYLFPAVGISAVVLVILFIYLCCAAGRKPGSEEARAEGLNRIPLDGYFVAVCLGLTGAAIVGVEGTQYLMDGSVQVAIAFAAAMAYGASLLVVAFCFAAAAQLKTPDGFWWRNSLCGWCWRLFVICLAWGIKASLVCWGWLKKLCRALSRMLEEKGAPWLRRCCKAVWKFLLAMTAMLQKWAGKAWQLVIKLCQWCWSCLVRFVEMLPMTWQWLLTGFAIIILLAMTLYTGAAPWGICLTIALVLYGTHAFGTLLEGVKRMNKGDLDGKVEDKFLIGSFREFAGELNGLANVAVVAAQKQLKSERMKTELITNVSHDIKTPLTSIINYVDLLEKPHTPEEQEVYLEVLSRQSLRLKKLIEDLMEMSKASTGNMAVDITTVDAVEAVNQALGEFADKLDKAQLIPVFRHPEEPVRMQADGRLVWRVLSNLLSNAVKYALPGTRLYLDVAAVEGKVIISIKNISREELNVSADELLERFVRGDASRNTEGSGLGLNIAQSLTELQKGQLQLLVDGDLFKVTLLFPGA